MSRRLGVIFAWCALGLFGCAGGWDPGATGIEGPSVAVNVAALNLSGVGDVVWDLEVVNGRTPTADVVWQRRISSTGYGDGAGSASYVGPCDADPTVSENTVKVWVVGVYSGPVTALGSFASGAQGGATGAELAFQNPTTSAAPLTRKVDCVQNADVGVQFDVALMRPAQQGFFDIAVNFNDIFCSAKFDCCTEEAGACTADIKLLFEPGGGRGSTMVLGFACTAGARTGVETELYLDALELDCTSPTDFTTGFGVDLVLSPAGAAGNQCTAGELSSAQCGDVVTEANGVQANTYLFQIGVYRGFEQLQSGGVDAQKAYWNVALGVKRKVGSGPGIEDCWLRTRGTAADALGGDVAADGTVAAGAVYPYVQWEVKLDSCAAEPLTFGDAAAMVRTEYTQTDGTGTAFTYGFGPSRPAGPFVVPPCGVLGVPCPAGFTCDAAAAVGSSYPAFCVSDAGDEVYVPQGTFWMGCNSVTDGTCSGRPDEQPQHLVSLSAYAVDRTAVTAEAYKACGSCTAPSDVSPTSTNGTYGPSTKQTHPINYVTWTQATAFCAAQSKRLCTEAEWERAARGGCETVEGTCQTAMRQFPWGNSAPTCAQANFKLGDGPCESATYTAAADSRVAGASPYGALNLAGNVWEWTFDWWGPYPTVEPNPDPTGPTSGTYMAMRGGHFGYTAVYIRASRRLEAPPSGSAASVGFRCCRSLP